MASEAAAIEHMGSHTLGHMLDHISRPHAPQHLCAAFTRAGGEFAVRLARAREIMEASVLQQTEAVQEAIRQNGDNVQTFYEASQGEMATIELANNLLWCAILAKLLRNKNRRWLDADSYAIATFAVRQAFPGIPGL